LCRYDAGLGKTIQTIAFVAAILKSPAAWDAVGLYTS
jgi:SNF2 family DNA or RNA helicase